MNPLTLEQVDVQAIDPAMILLTLKMDSPEARVLLGAIGFQESGFEHRYQVLDGGGRGPARGFWQFELGSARSKGGVWGVALHPSTKGLLSDLCKARGVLFDPPYIWAAIENDDVLAAGLARLLILTDAFRLPAIGDVEGAWALYAFRCWRPGKPHKDAWAGNYAKAVAHALAQS